MDDSRNANIPPIRTLRIPDAKRALLRLVHDVHGGNGRVVIGEPGAPAAALVSVSDLERLILLDQGKAERRTALEAIGAAFADVPLEELERQLARIVAEERERRFAVIDEMREAFKDVPPEQIERDVVAIVREMREADEAARRAGEEVALERRPA